MNLSGDITLHDDDDNYDDGEDDDDNDDDYDDDDSDNHDGDDDDNDVDDYQTAVRRELEADAGT